jgi:hypothetical protein
MLAKMVDASGLIFVDANIPPASGAVPPSKLSLWPLFALCPLLLAGCRAGQSGGHQARWTAWHNLGHSGNAATSHVLYLFSVEVSTGNGRHGGYSAVRRPKGHAAALAERRRKDFFIKASSFRFKPIAEYGTWEGRTNIVPT